MLPLKIRTTNVSIQTCRFKLFVYELTKLSPNSPPRSPKSRRRVKNPESTPIAQSKRPTYSSETAFRRSEILEQPMISPVNIYSVISEGRSTLLRTARFCSLSYLATPRQSTKKRPMEYSLYRDMYPCRASELRPQAEGHRLLPPTRSGNGELRHERIRHSYIEGSAHPSIPCTKAIRISLSSRRRRSRFRSKEMAQIRKAGAQDF